MKYMGSKARISRPISSILNNVILQNDIVQYVEPFVGGSNMIQHIVCPKRYGLDSNEYLIAMWKALQSGWNPQNHMSREEYTDIRDNKERYPKEMVAIAGFCATYNAKWFGGYAGLVTTKTGTQRNYYDEAIRNVLGQRSFLKDVIFAQSNYSAIEPSRLFGAAIYCDPPYAGTTRYKDDFDHKKFWGWARKMSENNFVYVSEYGAPEDFECVWSGEIVTTLDNGSRKNSVEKLFKWKG